jgi:NAD(P)-dependent dehydrogenase (short-subunit alcohol dehydrogenase family)
MGGRHLVIRCPVVGGFAMNCLVITGASAGIGLATARRFLAAGFRVVNISRRPCPAQGVVQLTADLGDPASVTAIRASLDAAVTGATRLVVIHNAARMLSDTAAFTDDAALRAVFEVNLVAPNTLNGFLLPHMRTANAQSGSAILYVGSTLSEKAVPGSFSYVTSKHALIGMMRATCQDLAGTGIHTACICPGFTDTEMLRDHVPSEAMGAISAMSAFGRLIDPEEIAATLSWAADSPVINGAVIHANLGQVER